MLNNNGELRFLNDYTEKSLSSELIFNGRVFRITLDRALLVNGHEARREVVHHSGGAAVVALNGQGEVALVRQYRYAVGQTMTEIPAGKIEPGEDPREAAIRELEEEAGLAADTVADFGLVIPTCAYDTERIYLYLATGLSEVPRHLDADEFVDLFWLPLEQAVRMVLDGRIQDGKTVSGLLRAKLLLDAGQLPLR
jgi:ADP-ribose pyrophosphatase